MDLYPTCSTSMEVPIAFPVGIDYKVPEVYTLEQKQEALSNAEQELDALLRSSEDFFESREDMDATLREIRQHPDQVYTKPFMKKIAAAILRVNACQQEVEWASESVVDTSLTPAQVKAQVKQLLEAQRKEWTFRFQELQRELHEERQHRMKLEKRIHAEHGAQLRELRQELDEERQHRKAFQAKVKIVSEEMIANIAMREPLHMSGHSRIPLYTSYQFIDIFGTPHFDMHLIPTFYDSFVYKRAGCEPYPLKTDPNYVELCNEVCAKRDKISTDFKFTVFDGTEK